MELWIRYLRQKQKVIFVQILFWIIFLVVFMMYHLPAGAVLYPALLCLCLGVLIVLGDYRKFAGKHELLQNLQKLSAEIMEGFPAADTVEEGDYQQIIALLRQEQRQLENRMQLRYQDMMDYYTVWVHQIKTPIASMRLTLQNEDSELSRKISGDLFRIEQYVEMVLCYLRLDGESTDYVIAEYDLDVIVRQAVRKFAGQFIGKKISLSYEPLSAAVITDEKWLQFVLEQVLSNALKYTENGNIAVYMEAPKTLCIRDTGIGIAPEDLPRIFEKGYTGYNGRGDKKASGLGLYLCRRICDNLGHDISAESEPDRGTVIKIHLEQRKLQVE